MENLMKGELQCDDLENVVANIQRKKNISRKNADGTFCNWGLAHTRPSTPSKLIKNDETKWYLVYDGSGFLGAIHQNRLIESDYLLAEMFAEDGFELISGCKIHVSCLV